MFAWHLRERDQPSVVGSDHGHDDLTDYAHLLDKEDLPPEPPPLVAHDCVPEG